MAKNNITIEQLAREFLVVKEAVVVNRQQNVNNLKKIVGIKEDMLKLIKALDVCAQAIINTNAKLRLDKKYANNGKEKSVRKTKK